MQWPRRAAQRVQQVVDELVSINQRVEPLEDRFSATLGDAARWLQGLWNKIRAAAALLFVLCVTYLMNRELCRAEQAEAQLRESAAQLQESERHMKFLAMHDKLTGLPNRAMFQEHAHKAIAHA